MNKTIFGNFCGKIIGTIIERIIERNKKNILKKIFTPGKVAHISCIVSRARYHASLSSPHAVHHVVVRTEPGNMIGQQSLTLIGLLLPVKLVLLPPDVGPLDDDEDDGANPEQNTDPAPSKSGFYQPIL